MTPIGGTHGDGTILNILTDGTGYNVDYDFTGGPNDGANPRPGCSIERQFFWTNGYRWGQ